MHCCDGVLVFSCLCCMTFNKFKCIKKYVLPQLVFDTFICSLSSELCFCCVFVFDVLPLTVKVI